MEIDRLQFQVKQSVKHQQSILNTLAGAPHNDLGAQDTIGGVLRNGQLGWTALGSHIAVYFLKTGSRVSSSNFEISPQCGTTITCVCEVIIPGSNACVLAIGLQSAKQSGKLCLFAVQGSRKLRTIEIVDKVTSCCFIRASAVRKNDLLQFDGCLAIGTDIGQIILIDLDLNQCKEVLYGHCKANNEANCLLALASVGSNEIQRQQESAKNSDMNFGIRLEALSDATPVISILSLPPLRSLAIGMSDGRMILYSLSDLEAYHLAHPPEQNSPLVKMAYIEPADDPRACVYVWASHANAKMSIAVMHSIMFSSKVLTNDNVYVYKNFQVCKSSLTMPIYAPQSFPISCQSITKTNTDDDIVLRLCLLVWTARARTHVCVFDLNQWYKEQMPDICDLLQHSTYLAVFELDNTMPLDVWMNQSTVTPFSSIQRPEEHFYPSSLSFDCVFLSSIDSKFLHWTGLQNQILDKLSGSGPNAILEPNRGFDQVRSASLIPQFTDYNFSTNLNIQMKQEFLLSIALEYNCNGLLRDCARAWADGSHMGQEPSKGLTLSTLTDWIWKRASLIKEHCNSLCISLFDHSGTTMGLYEQKVLLNCSRQLKTLSDLLTMILTTCRQFIPNSVLDTLQSQRNSICMAFEYQEVLQWLLNMGLLPEGAPNPYLFEKANAVPYPYHVLRNYYTTQRQKFKDLNRDLMTSRRSCKILYIDSFIETECNPSILRSEWRKGNGDGLYPPPSLQSMLRTLLVPGVTIENKYMLFVYLFLDLSIALKDDVFVGVVEKLIKFPAVFRLNPALIKTTQAFWNLDHGQFLIAIEDITSPLTRDHQLQTWQQELLIESLLLQDVPQLALRVLRAPGPAIAPVLAIRTLLANDLVTEAFLLQRTKADEGLLLEFFRSCHEHRKWHLVLDLALTGAEEQCLGEFLRTSDSSMGENLHFLYLLQRSKYIEAIAFIADLQQNQRQHSHRSDLETPNTILSAYKLTMTPTTRKMSDIYYSLRDNIDKKLKHEENIPNPLSSKLLQSKLDLTGGVYHRSVLSTEQTTPSTTMFNQNKPQNHLDLNTVPFLRNPQYLMLGRQLQHVHNSGISYPVTFTQKQKRSNRDAAITLISDNEDDVILESQRKKRRLVGPEHPRPLTVLTVFKDRPSVSMVRSNDSLMNSTQRQKSPEIPNTVLTTPVVLSSRKAVAPVSPERVTTPHSILKVKIARDLPAMTTSRQSVSPYSIHERGRSVDTDEKSIRFSLPPQRLDTTIDEEEEDENETQHATEKSVETINADQASVSGDEFFSPNSSIDKTESEAQRLSHGPKPRKRLRSGSSSSGDTIIGPPKTISVQVEQMPVQRSLRSRSKTPDVDLPKSPQSKRSARSRSKTPDVESPSKRYAIVKSSTPLRRKPLSRLVLEANAKKVTSQTVVEQCIAESVIPEEMELSNVDSELAEQSSILNSSYDNIGSPRPSYRADDTSQFLKRWGVGAANSSESSDVSLDSGSKLCSHLSDSDASFVLNLQEVENARQRIVRIIPVQHVESAQIDVDDGVVAEKAPEFEITVENVLDNITEAAVFAVDEIEVHSTTSNSSIASTDDNVGKESSSSESENDEIIVLDSSSEEELAKKQPIVDDSSSWESDVDDEEDTMEDLQMQEDDENELNDDDFEDLEDELNSGSSCDEIQEDEVVERIHMNVSVAVNEVASEVVTVEDDEATVDDIQLDVDENVEDDIYSDLAATDLTDQVYGEMGDNNYDEDDGSEQNDAVDNNLNEALIWESEQTDIASATTLDATLSANEQFNEAIVVSESMQGDFSNLSATVDPKQTVEATQDALNTINTDARLHILLTQDSLIAEESNILNKGYLYEDTGIGFNLKEDPAIADMDAGSSEFTPDLESSDLGNEIKTSETDPTTTSMLSVDEFINVQTPTEIAKPTSEVLIVEPISKTDPQSVVQADPIPSTTITEIDSNSLMAEVSENASIVVFDSIPSNIQTVQEVPIAGVDSNSSKIVEADSSVDEVINLQPLNEILKPTFEALIIEPITVTEQQSVEMDVVVEEVAIIDEIKPDSSMIVASEKDPTAAVDSTLSTIQTGKEVPIAEIDSNSITSEEVQIAVLDSIPSAIETVKEMAFTEIDSNSIEEKEEVSIAIAVPLPSKIETSEKASIVEETERVNEGDTSTIVTEAVIEIQQHGTELKKEVATISETIVKPIEEIVNVENKQPIEQQSIDFQLVSEEASVQLSEKAVNEDMPLAISITSPASQNKKHESSAIKQAEQIQMSIEENSKQNKTPKSSGSGHNLRNTRARSNSADIKQLDSTSTTPQRRNLREKSTEYNTELKSKPKVIEPVHTQGGSDASTSKIEAPAKLPKRRSRKTKSTDQEDMDDNVSVASSSSVVSNRTTRSTRSRVSKPELNDDDDDDTKSIISFRSGKSKGRRGKELKATLPIISEETPTAPQSTEYSDSRRLTRHQKSVMNTIKKNMEAYKLNESTQRGLSSANNDEYEMEDDTSEEGSVITTSTRSNVSRKSTRLNLRSQKKNDGNSDKGSIETTSPKLEAIAEVDNEEETRSTKRRPTMKRPRKTAR